MNNYFSPLAMDYDKSMIFMPQIYNNFNISEVGNLINLWIFGGLTVQLNLVLHFFFLPFPRGMALSVAVTLVLKNTC